MEKSVAFFGTMDQIPDLHAEFLRKKEIEHYLATSIQI
jgi:hypothetical protein